MAFMVNTTGPSIGLDSTRARFAIRRGPCILIDGSSACCASECNGVRTIHPKVYPKLYY